MARKATYNQIIKGLSDAMESYRIAASGGVTEDTRKYLDNKHEMIRQITCILASRNPNALQDFIDTANGWKRDCNIQAC